LGEIGEKDLIGARHGEKKNIKESCPYLKLNPKVQREKKFYNQAQKAPVEEL